MCRGKKVNSRGGEAVTESESLPPVSRSDRRKYLLQWLHHKLAFPHPRMRQCKRRTLHPEMVVEQEVYVDGAVMIVPVLGLGGSAQFSLNLLCDAQTAHRREGGFHTAGCIQEAVRALKPPRFSFDERGYAYHFAYALPDGLKRTPEHLAAVAHVGAQREIEFGWHDSPLLSLAG